MFTRRSLRGLSSLAAIETARAAELGPASPSAFSFVTNVRHGTHGEDQQARVRAFHRCRHRPQSGLHHPVRGFLLRQRRARRLPLFSNGMEPLPPPQVPCHRQSRLRFPNGEFVLKAWPVPDRYPPFDTTRPLPSCSTATTFLRRGGQDRHLQQRQIGMASTTRAAPATSPASVASMTNKSSTGSPGI